MLRLSYSKKYHKQLVRATAIALLHGKAVAFPTDTSYGLAVDANNPKAIRKLYQIKGRDFSKPVHIIPGNKKTLWLTVSLSVMANKIIRNFWPGAITLVLPLRKPSGNHLRRLSAGTGYLGIRMPNNQFAIDLAKQVGGLGITATSVNLSGQPDCYSVGSIIKQFSNQVVKPDIIIDGGRLARRKPSTVVRIADHDHYEILRNGPVTKQQIQTKIN